MIINCFLSCSSNTNTIFLYYFFLPPSLLTIRLFLLLQLLLLSLCAPFFFFFYFVCHYYYYYYCMVHGTTEYCTIDFFISGEYQFTKMDDSNWHIFLNRVWESVAINPIYHHLCIMCVPRYIMSVFYVVCIWSELLKGKSYVLCCIRLTVLCYIMSLTTGKPHCNSTAFFARYICIRHHHPHLTSTKQVLKKCLVREFLLVQIKTLCENQTQ